MAYNTVTVPATAGGIVIIEANPQRLSLIITNTGTQTITVNIGAPLTAGTTFTWDLTYT